MKRELRIPKSGRQYYNYYKRTKGQTFKKARELCLARDNSQCRDCGATDTALDVHHLAGSDYKYKIAAHNGDAPHNALSNLIALCHACHQKRHQAHQIKLGRVVEVNRLRGQGLTFQEIGDCLRISRQRAHQLSIA